MIHLFIVLLLTALTAELVDIRTALFVACTYMAGLLLISVVNKKMASNCRQIFMILFEAGWLYMLLCYVYMVNHNYEWLLAFDSYDAFIPRTISYIEYGQSNLLKIYRIIFEDYNFFYREEYLYWVYSCTWGVLINKIGASFYLGLQTSSLIIYAFCGVVIYKLFQNYGFNSQKSYRHTLAICLASILFFYSSQILRDIHILLLYLLAFYYSSKPYYSIRTTLALIAIFVITCGFRIESGLFIAVTIPLYFLYILQKQKRNQSNAIFFTLLFSIIGIVFITRYYNSLYYVYDKNMETYVEGVEEGAGITALLHQFPVIGNFASILFNASTPLPVWSRLIPSNNSVFGGHVNNIMNLTRISAVILNIATYVYIIFWLISSKLRKRIKSRISTPLKYQMIIGTLFLYLQSAVISQRRLMGYYCIFYIFFFYLLDNLPIKEKRNINIFVIITIVFLQILGVVYLK